MTDRLSNGFVCVPVGTGTAVLTFGTEGDEMVIDLKAPGFPRASVRLSVALGTELRERYLECLGNAQAEADAKARKRAAAMDELIALSADEI